MRKFFFIVTAGILLLTLAWGCKGTVNSDGEIILSYEELIALAWAAFEQKDFTTAVTHFEEAKNVNVNKTEAYSGLGWSYLKLDLIEQSLDEFSICSSLNDPMADLHAGWAFALNTQKKYEESNEQVDEALELDPNWSFDHNLPLDRDDLLVLKAENYFVLGQFSASLAQVQLLNPSFSVNVATDEGQAALAAEIERLKAGS